MAAILGRDQERADARPDVVDLAVVGGDQERLVDVRADPPAGDGRLGHQVEPSPDLVAVDGELGRRRRLDDAVLRAAIEAAAQVILPRIRS